MYHAKKKPLAGALALLLAALLAAGCAGTVPPGSSGESRGPDSYSQPPEPDPQEPKSPDSIGLLNLVDIDYMVFPPRDPGDNSPLVEWRDQYEGKAILYLFDTDALQYTGYRLSHPAQATVLQLVLAAGGPMGYIAPEMPLPVSSVRVEKSMAIVDLDSAVFLTDFPQEKQGLRVLAGIARTLVENNRFLSDVGFTMDGGGRFQTDYLTLEADGYGHYEIPPLYAEVSDAEYAALRELAVYPGLEEGQNLWHLFDPLADDSLKELPDAQALAMVLYQAGNAEVDFEGPGQVPDKVKIKQALAFLATAVADDPGESRGVSYYPQLAPIAQAVEDASMIPREWVEQAVKDLYGPDAQVLHQPANHWTWHAREGVYTPPHIGGWAGWMPYIFDIREQDDGYRVEFIHSYMGMGGSFGGGDGQWWEPTIPADDFAGLKTDSKFLSFAAAQPRKEAFIQKDGGHLYLRWVKAL